MSGKAPTLTFSLAGYDHRTACGLLTRRLLPAYLRHLCWVLLAVVAALLLAVLVAVNHGYRFSGYQAYLVAAAIIAILILGQRKQRSLLWRAVEQSPLRVGPMRVDLGVEGLTLSWTTGHSTYFWNALVDAVPSKDGLLILLGDMDYIPIPASAFADGADQAATLEQLQTRIRAARDSET